MWPKLVELNASVGAVGGAPLAADDEAALRAVVDVLEATSRWHASAVPRRGVAVLARALASWPRSHAFPLLDVARVLLAHPDGAAAAAAEPALLPALLAAARGAPADARPAALLAGRALGNALKHAPARAAFARGALWPEAAAALLAFPHATVRGAGAALLHNVAHAAALAAEGAGGAAAGAAWLGEPRALLAAAAAAARAALADADLDAAAKALLAGGTVMLADATGARAGIAAGKAAGFGEAVAAVAAAAPPGGAAGAWEAAQECTRLLQL